MINEKRKKQLERLAEQTHHKRLREQQLRETYQDTKDAMYFDFIERHHLTEWKNNGRDLQGRFVGGHYYYVPKIGIANPLYESFQVLTNDRIDSHQKLKEVTTSDMMRISKPVDVSSGEALRECINLASQNTLEGVVEQGGIL